MSEYTERDYEAIEAAVMESPRGRWFLKEFARRNRAADTLMLLEAIHKLERGIATNDQIQAGAEAAAEPPDNAPEPSPDLSAENLKYFEGDEDLFEWAPAMTAAAPGAEAAPLLATVGEEQDRDSGAAAKADPKDRIVFIRRASSKETSIPLADEAEDPVAAARLQPLT